MPVEFQIVFMEKYIDRISKEKNLEGKNIRNLRMLLDEGATIPFISRYRKEMTGSMDEVQIAEVRDLFAKLEEIDKRREAILKSIDEQEKLTPELKKKIEEADSMTELEDLYLPFKQKRKTRASIAKEKGLEPLAAIIMKQSELNIIGKAEAFINKDVPDSEAALQGARDIIAEWISENKRARDTVRIHFERHAVIYSKLSKGKEEEGIKYKDYFEFSEKLSRCPSHRILAMRRGEEEGFLKLSLEPDLEKLQDALEGIFIKGLLRCIRASEDGAE